jgi:hypothetical protein
MNYNIASYNVALNDEILSRVVYEELGGDPFFFNTVDEFHSFHNISQALRTM